MCGIVGYVGDKSAVGIIVDGLKRLEYRGYDSAGVAVLDADGLQVRRAPGRLKALGSVLREKPVTGSIGIGHRRWATHGRPSEENAHPHTDCGGRLVVVHNGILENYLEIKERLASDGHTFKSQTDTEVLAHLIEHHLKTTGRLEQAVRAALREVTGSYAVGVVSAAAPDRLIAAKQGAGSVVVGLGRGEMFIASDIPAILAHTRDVVILEDDDMAVVTAHGVELTTTEGDPVQREPVKILWDPIMAEKGGYRHFMLKEIYEQPRAITDTFRGRIAPETGSVVLPDVSLDPSTVKAIQRVVLVACGTAWHAAMLTRMMVERLAGIPAEVDLASEFRYRDAIVGPETLVIAVSQSGETADTIGAVKAARLKGCPILAVTNVVGSALAREGALKLKEISYIHAEGYAGGEMKHGPIALIADGLPVVALAPRDSSYDRMLGNMEEVRARDGLLIAVCHPGDRAVASKAQHVIEVPPCAELLAPLLTVVPLQLLAYHVAVRRGCDVDQPRNLAKSVTVE